MPVQPAGEVRARVRARVPRDPVRPLERKLRAVDEPAGVLEADGRRAAPLDPCGRRSRRDGCLLRKPKLEVVQPEREARRVLRQRHLLSAASVPERADGEHRGRTEDERYGGDRARGQPAPPRRLGLEPPTTGRVEARLRGAEAWKLRDVEHGGRHRQRQPSRAPRLLAEPEHVRLQPHLAGSPPHGHTSFARTAACPPRRSSRSQAAGGVCRSTNASTRSQASADWAAYSSKRRSKKLCGAPS